MSPKGVTAIKDKDFFAKGQSTVFFFLFGRSGGFQAWTWLTQRSTGLCPVLVLKVCTTTAQLTILFRRLKKEKVCYQLDMEI